jgi:hypothetical protein
MHRTRRQLLRAAAIVGVGGIAGIAGAAGVNATSARQDGPDDYETIRVPHDAVTIQDAVERAGEGDERVTAVFDRQRARAEDGEYPAGD